VLPPPALGSIKPPYPTALNALCDPPESWRWPHDKAVKVARYEVPGDSDKSEFRPAGTIDPY